MAIIRYDLGKTKVQLTANYVGLFFQVGNLMNSRFVDNLGARCWGC